MFSSNMSVKIATAVNISDYIIAQCVPAKQPEVTLAVAFDETSLAEQLAEAVAITETHAQLKCKELRFPFAQWPPITVPIKAANVLVEGDEGKYLKGAGELVLDVSAKTLNFLPGDTIGILPRNSPKLVEKLLNHMGLSAQADRVCNVQIAADCTKKNAKVPAHIPTLTTPRAILSDCLTLDMVPRKQFIAALAAHTTDTTERDFLRSLSAKEGVLHYQKLIFEKGLQLIDLLSLCASCKPPLQLLVEELPRLLPRPYSLASSPLDPAKEIRIVYSILPHRPGVTTQMMDMYARQQEPLAHSNIAMYIREPSQFRYTAKMATQNQILIGVGSAVAPFIGFLMYKQHLGGTGETWLYAGARSEQTLPHYGLLTSLASQGVLNKFKPGFSGENHDQNNYVQAMIAQESDLFVHFLLKPDTTLFVCADANRISKDIATGITYCFAETLCLHAQEAKRIMFHLRERGKYREDVWL